MPFPKNREFYKLIEKARFQNEDCKPFVIYQKPNTAKVNGIFPKTSNLIYTSNFSESGFVFSPFNTSDKTILFSNENRIEASYAGDDTKIRVSSDSIKIGREPYLELINKAIKRIGDRELKKVVVSRKITTQTQKNAFELFEQLLNVYPNAFKYLWFHPKVGMWLGATPETLLKVNKNSLTTTSLAGTLPAIDDDPPNWSTKEVEEQQLVTDYILTALSDTLINIEATVASSIKAGNLWHLKSIIRGDLNPETSLDEIIKVLQPTPAVCGVPKMAAKEFLIKNEGYDREFYTGFLGELNFDASRTAHLYVNLRCMKLNGENATIFIGGGITKESNAESEWNETQYKSKTMLSLL
ncbi:isochorismate synthase [uncultured Croceitalea sp.]|uniref:isochorismate synthase n=1 Tax=uncultured Croceitalea sp. TaxID=1798908 RepID=UPI0033068515